MASKRIEVIARGLLIVNHSVLLCRNVEGGYLFLPGGHVEFGESAPRALEREIREETGLDVMATGLLFVSEGVFSARGRMHHEINLVFGLANKDTTAPPGTKPHSGLPTFHVEHPQTDPVLHGHTVPSLEPDIEFKWVKFDLVWSSDVRPFSIKRWLVSASNPTELLDRVAGWASDITAR